MGSMSNSACHDMTTSLAMNKGLTSMTTQGNPASSYGRA
jgi:hypothetical protein